MVEEPRDVVRKPHGGHWDGVLSTPSMPIGIEAPVGPGGATIPHRCYDTALPGWKALMDARPPVRKLPAVSSPTGRGSTQPLEEPRIKRPVYTETERFARNIATYLAGERDSEVLVEGRIEGSRDSEGETHLFEASVDLGGRKLRYVHPRGGTRTEHGKGGVEEEVKGYVNECLDVLADAVERQGKGALVTEKRAQYDLKIMRL
ncbi:MAG: hypothetical protein ABH864_05410 [archaeon]